MSDRTTRLFPLTRAAVNRTYLSKLEKGRELWGAGIIAKLATVLELASVVSHAKLYIWFGTCYAVWHGSKQHGTGDNG